MTEHDAPTRFVSEAEVFLARLSHEELYAFARTCTEKLEEILRQGFAAVNEGFNPDEGTKPINLIREKLFPVFGSKLASTFTADDIPLREEKIIFDMFKSEHPVDVAIKSLQEKLKLIADETSMATYVAFTNALDKAIHGGLTVRDPMFVKADAPADALYVVFAGMVCFPEFKKSIARLGHVDQLHILDPHRSWYMQGPEGKWNGYGYYTRMLDKHIGKLKAETPYRKVCFLGNSMGGSGACLYATRADAVLAFCPQTIIPKQGVPEEVNQTYRKRLAENLTAAWAAGKQIRIHRGGGDSDVVQCGRLPDIITPIVHEGCGVHNLPGYLKEQGTLMDVLGSVL
ncbi:MAG: hypothetical protein RRC34_13015 [Lentisphaeria bacterium]|nr:hypothetical protein [Lentisphaeria bacterium]